MPAKGIKVDGSFNCAIRTTATEIAGDAPRRVPLHAMHGRRWIRILNVGRVEGGQRVNVKVVIGDADVAMTASTAQGFGLDIDEYVDLPFDDSISPFAIAEPNETAELRTLELK